MRFKHPASAGGANGIYGGIGSKPAPETWVPGKDESEYDGDRVPRRFRRLRLKRRRTHLSRMHDAELIPGWLYLWFFFAAIAAGWCLVFLT